MAQYKREQAEDYAAFWRLVGERYKTLKPEGARFGQTAFNTLAQERPDLADAVRATANDPYYLDSNLPQFCTFIQEKWNS